MAKDLIKYQTRGTCSKEIILEIENDIIINMNFIGGCQGNLSGIATLVIGMNIYEVIKKLQGITCGSKPTSCPDQLAQCLIEYTKEKAKTAI